MSVAVHADALTPLRIEIPEAELEDLRERLRRGRSPALHVRSPLPDALPLVLAHGWPGSEPAVFVDELPTSSRLVR